MKIFQLNVIDITNQLEKGSPVIFPTDTLPALGICPEHAHKLWEIKKRPSNKPLILMGASKENLFEFVKSCALGDALAMAEKHWPGALTMVLPASGKIVELLNPGSMSIGVRIPDHYLAIELLNKIGPLATTSANISGQSPIEDAEKASKIFPEIPLLGPIPWPKPSGLASSVIEWIEPKSWRFLRRGAVIPSNVI